MAGESQSVAIGGGREIQIKRFSQPEMDVFTRDFPKLAAHYTKYSVDREGRHLISDVFWKNEEILKTLAQSAKLNIEPSAGQFGGMNAMQDFGFRLIRPEDLCVAAQGHTFDVALAALTKDNWYGYLHNAVIGAAYNATALYLRKQVMVAILGFLDVSAVQCAEELQWELSAKPLPIWNMLTQMRGADIPFFELPQPMVINPAQTYRSQFKTAVVAGNMALIPVGVTFLTAEFMRTTAQTPPSTTAP